MQIVGLDIGYGKTKAYNGKKLACFPSVVGYPVKIKYQENLLTNGTMGPGDGIELKIEGGWRFVGDLALGQSTTKWAPQDKNRTGTDTMMVLALAAFSELGVKGDIFLVTGLPIIWYEDKEKIARQFKGKHLLHRKDHEPVTINVVDVLVLPQPFGSFYAKIINERGQLITENMQMTEERVAVIDIGMHTTDYILVDHLRYIETGSYGLETAMSRVYELVGRELKDRYEVNYDLHKTDQALRRGKINVFGQPVDISDVVDPILSAVAQEIGSHAARLWGDGRTIDRILVTGGGAEPLGSYLVERFPHNLEILGGSSTANVRGYYNYGVGRYGKK